MTQASVTSTTLEVVSKADPKARVSSMVVEVVHSVQANEPPPPPAAGRRAVVIFMI